MLNIRSITLVELANAFSAEPAQLYDQKSKTWYEILDYGNGNLKLVNMTHKGRIIDGGKMTCETVQEKSPEGLIEYDKVHVKNYKYDLELIAYRNNEPRRLFKPYRTEYELKYREEPTWRMGGQVLVDDGVWRYV